jgi:hypothetical protein
VGREPYGDRVTNFALQRIDFACHLAKHFITLRRLR